MNCEMTDFSYVSNFHKNTQKCCVYTVDLRLFDPHGMSRKKFELSNILVNRAFSEGWSAVLKRFELQRVLIVRGFELSKFHCIINYHTIRR